MLLLMMMMMMMMMMMNYFTENRGIHDPKLFEGDMILTPRQRYKAEHGMDVDSDRKRGSSKLRLWPGGVVVYEITSGLGKLLATEQQSKAINQTNFST